MKLLPEMKRSAAPINGRQEVRCTENGRQDGRSSGAGPADRQQGCRRKPSLYPPDDRKGILKKAE